jgi:hypothetical protein
MKFTNPEARYLAQSSREWMRRARIHERTVKIKLECWMTEPRSAAMNAAQCADTCRHEAAQRMKLARSIEQNKTT